MSRPDAAASTHGFQLTERHRSRTCLASGYDAVLVLKTSWGTGPRRSVGELICLQEPDCVWKCGFAAHMTPRTRSTFDRSKPLRTAPARE
jgi:hypothetical protein